MKDKLKQEIEVNDYVCTIRSHYRELVFAKVIKITPKMLRVEYKSGGAMCAYTVRSDQCVKIDPQLAMAYILGH